MAEVQARPGVVRLSDGGQSGDGALSRLEAERATLTERAIDALRAAIVDGRLQPGEFTSVARLADRLGVSRTPVREALLHLAREGMVRFERNRGVRILESTAHDLDEVFTLRLLLEVPAARRAAEVAGPDELAALATELRAMAERMAHDDEPGFMRHDKAFHEVLLRATGNRRIASLVGGLRDAVRFRGASTVGHGRDLQTIYAEHERILEAVRVGDPEAVADAMRTHLVSTRRLLLAGDPAAQALGDSPPWAAGPPRRRPDRA
jgi:DNA-binding GntR family transcriptional regulator